MCVLVQRERERERERERGREGCVLGVKKVVWCGLDVVWDGLEVVWRWFGGGLGLT